ncbi:hypothetical protein SCAR479_00592 [Seiridium cardinale]|uniref:Uncharacterized protein n=1 Tax=Seiridium cardinale TaxID=138064 RepID=A0ABR2Y9X9_9PEZI
MRAITQLKAAEAAEANAAQSAGAVIDWSGISLPGPSNLDFFVNLRGIILKRHNP